SCYTAATTLPDPRNRKMGRNRQTEPPPPMTPAARRGRWRRFLLIGVFAASTALAERDGAASAPDAMLAAVTERVSAGRFAEAHRLIDQGTAAGRDDSGAADAMAFQRERMRRILLDFSLDEAAVRAAVRKQIPDLRHEEFERWRRAGLFDSMEIDGALRY